MNPITREEQYLNRLTGEEGIIPDKPVTREEQYFARLCGGDNVIPDKPVTRREQYLATLCGEDVITPTKPVTRIEQYMAFASGESESKPEKPITREEMYWDKYQGGDVPEEKTIAFTDIITVTDALARPAVDLQAEITATQNLNGYEYPWVGGAGVNLLPKLQDGTYSGNGVTAVVKDGIATLSGTTTASGNALIIPLDEAVTVPNQTCYVHWLNSDVNSGIAPSIELSTDIQNTGISAMFASVNRISEVPSNRQGITVDRCRFWLAADRTLSGTFAPMICLTNTATAYAPYENICPISGRTEVNVTRTGKNLLDVSKIIGQGDNFLLNRYELMPNTNYVVSFSDKIKYVSYYLFHTDGTRTSHDFMGHMFSISANDNVVGVMLEAYTSGEIITVEEAQPMIEIGTTATAYEPYQSDTYTVSLTQAGTVYGGVLDVTTGELTVDKAIKTVNDLTWNYNATYGIFYTYIPNKKIGRLNTISDSYRTVDKYYTSMENGEISGTTIDNGLNIKDTRFNNLNDFKSEMAVTQLVYELATPQTISLTPTEVMMLENNNTIWADSGRVQLTYLSKAAQRVQTMNASLKANTLKISKGAVKK